MRKVILTVLALLGCVALAGIAQDSSGDLALLSREANDDQMDLLLQPTDANWSNYTENSIKFNLTPPVHDGDAIFDGFLPVATAQFARSGNKLLIKLSWGDTSENVTGKGRKYPDAGEEHIYIQQTESTSNFADAACIMIPQLRQETESYPSLMMGQGDRPVDIYLWRAGEGFSALSGKGRATVARTKIAIIGNVVRSEGGWSVVMQIDNIPSRTPVSFAIWDGGRAQRDGLKYYSLWYEVE
jgi:hypothetical protein